MAQDIQEIEKKINAFNRKYYLNIFIRGSILSLIIMGCYFLLATIIEHNLWLPSWTRLLIFFSFFLIVFYCVFRFLKEPLFWWLAKKGLTREQSAKLIGERLPEQHDSLLNLLQLAAEKNSSDLHFASIHQKANALAPYQFETFVDFSENKRYAQLLLIPVAITIALLLFKSEILTKSTNRILQFNTEFSPEAPFRFSIPKQNLVGFYNEDLKIPVVMEGTSIPKEAYVVTKNQRIKLSSLDHGTFEYTLEKIQEPLQFQIEAAGYYSEVFHVELKFRPELANLSTLIEYPSYLKRKNERFSGTGNLEIPEGSTVNWFINTQNAEKVSMQFLPENATFDLGKNKNDVFEHKKVFLNDATYELFLQNSVSKNVDKIIYAVTVIKDQFPSIQLNNLQDSVLYSTIMLGGNVGDDYGITRLELHYTLQKKNSLSPLTNRLEIPIVKGQNQQSFFYQWKLESIDLAPGDQISYFVQVWDNDGVNGHKSSKSTIYSFSMPTQGELESTIVKSQQQTESNLNQSNEQIEKLRKDVDDASKKLKGKQNLDWQDKKMVDNILKQKNELEKLIEELKDGNKLLEQKKEAFTEQNQRIQDKAKQIQKLMEELLDDETRKLFEELQRLTNQNADPRQIQKLLEKINQNSENLEKELERTLALFKQLQYEYKIDQSIQQLKQLVEKQQSILDKTEKLEQESQQKKFDKSTLEDKSKALAEEQQQLQDELENTKNQMDELEKLGEELNNNADLPEQSSFEDIQNDQQESEDQLQNGQPSKAKSPQKKAIQKMQQMQSKMESMQNSMSMEMDMENLESLRQIIHGLVKLSFDQESIMTNFRELNQNDPRFNLLAQQQLKLKDDAKVIEDSLVSLSKRDPHMEAVIGREVSELNYHLESAISANKDRKRPQAASSMQFSMTSINNLALMLDNHFDMMMQMMANAKPSAGKVKKQNKPSLSQLQQQLNQKIEDLKGSGKGGRELSEELAEIAAEQARIRQALQEMEQKLGEQGKMPGGDLPSIMEQTETDLVNKQLTDQLIKRQQEILTRLLQAENSAREQDTDEERKGETAKDYDKELSKAFEEYLRLKEKEVELLKTLPPKLYPYYKREVGEYFKRLNN
jgi:hypothetical protein